MNTIDEEVKDAPITPERDFNKIMKLVKKFPLKHPIEFYHGHSEWKIPVYIFHNNWTC